MMVRKHTFLYEAWVGVGVMVRRKLSGRAGPFCQWFDDSLKAEYSPKDPDWYKKLTPYRKSLTVKSCGEIFDDINDIKNTLRRLNYERIL